MENRDVIRIKAPRVLKNKIEYQYEVNGVWQELTKERENFSIEYSCDISSVPESVMVIPLLCNLLPIAWVINGIIEVDRCDRDFADCLEDVKRGYQNMYPGFAFGGQLTINLTEFNKNEYEKEALTLFSGGVDAFFTLLAHLKETPMLFTLWGADVKLRDTTGWENVLAHIHHTKKEFLLDDGYARTAFREFFNEKKLHKYIEGTKENWWHGFQHGIGLIGHTAPIAYLYQIQKVYIASSFTEKEKGIVTCASDPTIDSQLRFCGTQVIHDGYEYSRQMKVHSICEYAVSEKQYPLLRVCWESAGGKNCCACEKCYRTIYAIIAEGLEPQSFGFDINPKMLTDAEKMIKGWYYFDPVLKTYWNDIKEKFVSQQSSFNRFPETKWILQYNFEDANKSFVKNIRNSRVGKLGKKIKRRLVKTMTGK